ncbi:hypothetical protein AB3S75_043816 [Citrus x aurantiifolia]
MRNPSKSLGNNPFSIEMDALNICPKSH